MSEDSSGFTYTQFRAYCHRWAQTLDPVMRHQHPPGEKMFVDWAGQTVPVQEADGSVSEASVFIAVFGSSNKTFARAFPDQKLPSWIRAHCQAYAFFEGMARVTVPDNPKTAVISPCRYEPLLPAVEPIGEHQPLSLVERADQFPDGLVYVHVPFPTRPDLGRRRLGGAAGSRGLSARKCGLS